jgi:hypothetical protein
MDLSRVSRVIGKFHGIVALRLAAASTQGLQWGRGKKAKILCNGVGDGGFPDDLIERLRLTFDLID